MNSAAKHFLKRGATDNYVTPPEIVRVLGKFDLDPYCGILQPFKHARINYTEKHDGLVKSWHGRVFMNPPYSIKLIEQFVDKFCLHANGIALVLPRVGTKWFDKLCCNCDAMLFRRGRITFLDARGQPTNVGAMGNVFFAFGKRNVKSLERSGWRGPIFYRGKSL